MTAKFFTHPFDARSVMLFASIALGSALAQAAPSTNSAAAAKAATTHTSRSLQTERNLLPSDPRRHQQRQPVKKNM